MNYKTEKLFNSLISRKSILLIILLVLFFLFRESIWIFYNENFVDKYLIKIKSHWIIDVTLFLLLILTIIISIYLTFIKKRVDNYFFFFALFIFILFFYCRIFTNKYLYEHYYWFVSVKYVDYFFILFGSILLLKIYGWYNNFKKPHYFNNPFYIDYPISVRNEDIYKRADFALLLAEKIQSELENKEAGALAIGINGPWGSGKTSFSNLVKENIKLENRIVIDFNPWRSSSSSKIIEDFFELLIDELKRFDPALSYEMNSYASTLTQIDENIITKSTETISEYIFGSLNKNESYNRVNDSISKLKKQLVIFIDDLDRLDINETLEVLRLVRNTANFNNLVYIVSYDKGYVLEAVKNFNPYNYRSFLEKIFQFEFLLPGFDNATIRNRLKYLLLKGLGPEFNTIINSAVDYVGYSGKNITSKILKNNRDILRFSNSLLFEIKQVINEVNFIDFYLIQLLKLKFTSVYKFVADHFELLFITDKGMIRLRLVSEKNMNEAFLKTLGLLDDERKASVDAKDKSTLFEEYIKANMSEGYSDLEKDTVLEIINLLLKEKELRVNSTSKDYKSFVYSKNFNNYFNIKLLESNFTAKEFEEFRYDNFQKYKETVFKWIEKGKLAEVQEKLEKIIDFSDKQEWENHWKLLIEIAKYRHRESGVYGINYREIIDVLNYPDNPKGIGHIFFNNRDEYLNYLWKIFECAPEPFVIEGSILTSALTSYAGLPFSDEKIEMQLLEYFKKYCNEHKEINYEFRELHKNAVRKSDKYGRDFEYQEEAQKLFVSHFLEYLKGSQLDSFIKHAEPGSDLFTIDFRWLQTFFPDPTYDNFEDYLEKSKKIKIEKDHYEEFMKFYDLYRANDYSAIEFVFLHLKPSLWTGGTKSNPTR